VVRRGLALGAVDSRHQNVTFCAIAWLCSLRRCADWLTIQENIQYLRHGQLPFLCLGGVAFCVKTGGVRFTVTPRVFSTVSTFPTWLVGFPCSNSMMKRSPVPEVIARSFWVAPICLRTDLTSSPISFGVDFMADNRVTVREYHGLLGPNASVLFPVGNNWAFRPEIIRYGRGREDCTEHDRHLGPPTRAPDNQSHRSALPSEKDAWHIRGMNEQVKADYRRKAFHEAAHVLIASTFGVAAEDMDAYIEARKGGEHGVYYCGVTAFCSVEKPPYNFSVIGWAGVLGEELAEKDLKTWKEELPGLLERYRDDLEGRAARKEGNGSLSFQDLRWIIGYSDVASTFNDAARLIETNYEGFLRIADRLMREANHNAR